MSNETVDGAVLTVSETRALEKKIEAQGTSLYELMQRAGRSVSDHVRSCFGADNTVVIFCGTGNNGGDGWVVAGDLANNGYSVLLVTPRAAEQLSVEPARSAAIATMAQKPEKLTLRVDPQEDLLASLLQGAQVVIDALLGVGFEGDRVKEPYRTWIEQINCQKAGRAGLHVIAVDVPSGLSADTGNAATPCIAADTTITMLAYKPGLLLDSAQQYCGTVHLARIASVS